MKNAKTYIGFLNTTLKGLSILTKNEVSKESAKHVMNSILTAIHQQSALTDLKKDTIKIEFIEYCYKHYDINLMQFYLKN